MDPTLIRDFIKLRQATEKILGYDKNQVDYGYSTQNGQYEVLRKIEEFDALLKSSTNP
jgi:hypothetical protein